MRTAQIAPARPRRLRSLAVAVAIACLCLILSTASALAQSAPPSPTPTAQPTPGPNNAPGGPATAAVGEAATSDGSRAAGLNALIEPDLLESIQQSIVGVVTVWEEPDDPLAMFRSVEPTAHTSGMPVVSVCSGWFDTPTTIVTAGHCVDPKEGRLALDLQNLVIDPATGRPLPLASVRPDPKRTVSVYQPHELAGRVITEPTIARVNSFRPAAEGDIARLDVFGLPPAKPLAIAPDEPRLGEPVTAIGFPGINFSATDGFDIKALLSGGQSPAEVLQDSRLQPVSTSGTITSRQFRNGVAVSQTNVDFAAGMSGGPIVNARAEVDGTASQMTVFGQNFNISAA